MSRTIYYLGAGASYGKRDRSTRAIIEGVPVVAEISDEFELFKESIANTVLPEEGISFHNYYHVSPRELEIDKDLFLRDIKDLMTGIQEHATIDTYARKLYLTGRNSDLNKLKGVLCAFFVWEQVNHKPDGRYDTFLANILEARTLNLPKEISIISWNYDSQIEMAYQSYRDTSGLSIFEKNRLKEWPPLPYFGRIFKVNGSASFIDSEIITRIKASTVSKELQIIEFYRNSIGDSSDLGFQMKTHLSFAWEKSDHDEEMRSSIAMTTLDTNQVVVIGYSFPYFNREIDREIFKNMPNLTKVYIQDPDPDAVSQSIQAVLPNDHKIEIILEKKYNQFLLPSGV